MIQHLYCSMKYVFFIVTCCSIKSDFHCNILRGSYKTTMTDFSTSAYGTSTLYTHSVLAHLQLTAKIGVSIRVNTVPLPD